MLQAGVPIKVIAARVGVSEPTIKRIKKKASVKCKLKNKANKEEKTLARELYYLGLSEYYIAKLLGVRASCLFREVWKKEGIL